jgi:hypothetical protein
MENFKPAVRLIDTCRSYISLFIISIIITLPVQSQPVSDYAFSKTGNERTSGTFTRSNATATTTVTLITPISIEVTNKMDFGIILLTGNSDGNVILDAETNSRTATGGVYLHSDSTDPQLAVFTITGEPHHSFTVSSPKNISLSKTGTGSLNLALNHSEVSYILDDTGRYTFKLGGVLSVPAATIAGTYSNTTDLTVIVQYN